MEPEVWWGEFCWGTSKAHSNVKAFSLLMGSEEEGNTQMESLILAQDKRWRRA